MHVDEFTISAAYPTLGHGHTPTPQGYVLRALAARISAGIATGAATRGIELRSVSSTVSGEIDVRRVLGIDPDVRKGFSSVSAEFDVDAVAPPEAIEALVASATEYSPVFDMLVNPTSVEATRRAPCAGG